MGHSLALHSRIAWGSIALAMVAAAAGTAGGASAAKGRGNEFRVLKPVADAYVTAFEPRANFGDRPVLRVDGTAETTAYIRFEPRKFRGEVASVTLLLYSNRSRGGRYAVRRVDGDWREKSLTYANAPDLSLDYMSARTVRRGWTAVDVTEFAVNAGGDPISLALTTHRTRALAFGSRESRHGPRLVVRFRARNEVERLVPDALRRK
ncbi:MAG TPA: DNRLRE domain-containing protein [Gaiellaceae bacterium]|nr:DNRLRE domain-containing protein [Gaiellaceae bacterium]